MEKEYVLLNKEYQVIYKGKNVNELYEYIESLYKQNLIKQYVGKKLSFDDLLSFNDLYKKYEQLKRYKEEYNINYNFDRFIEKLRDYLHLLDLMLAY